MHYAKKHFHITVSIEVLDKTATHLYRSVCVWYVSISSFSGLLALRNWKIMHANLYTWYCVWFTAAERVAHLVDKLGNMVCKCNFCTRYVEFHWRHPFAPVCTDTLKFSNTEKCICTKCSAQLSTVIFSFVGLCCFSSRVYGAVLRLLSGLTIQIGWISWMPGRIIEH